MEDKVLVDDITSRHQRLAHKLREYMAEFVPGTSKESFILNVYVKEFLGQEQDPENLIALKLILEEIIDDYEMDLESLIDKVFKITESDDNKNTNQNMHVVNNKNLGFIYLMMNPSMNGIVKIGLTRRTPEERMDELSKATGVPTPFILVYKEQFNECVHAEKVIHSILEERGERVSSNREFFNTEINDAIKVIQQVKQNDKVNPDYAELSHNVNDDKPLSKDYLEKGIDYLNGYGEYLQDYDRAIEYLEKAGKLGEAKAYYELGDLHIDTMREYEFTLDVKKAVGYFEKGRVLTGKYANYCNAGLALCYSDKYFKLFETKNYIQIDANAAKCWEWFFTNLDINDSDHLAIYYTSNCISNFLLNDDCSTVYKEKLESIALSIVKKFRYTIFDTAQDSKYRQDIKSFLLENYEIGQLDRKVDISWIPNGDFFNLQGRGTNFDVLIKKGSVNDDDILSFTNINDNNRAIESLWKDGIEVSSLNEGEKGLIKVTSIIGDSGIHLPVNDSGEFSPDKLTIRVLGNDNLEESTEDVSFNSVKEDKRETISTPAEIDKKLEKSFLGKIKSWFN